ncbi:MAG: tetratricopeptide repeat protein [Candidatus Polarisedimenticolia bacterium]
MTLLRGLFPSVLLAALVVLTFATSLPGAFVWDDRPLIVENALIRDSGSLGELLTSGFWQTGDMHDRFRSFFRPVVSASYAADYALWGLEPLAYRLTNLLLHLACCVLILRIAMGEGLPLWASWAGAAVFAVHPAHVESAAWISGRTDLLCGLFVLLSFAAHRRAETAGSGRGWRIASLLAFAVALFSKEMAATLPVLIAADRAMRPSSRPWMRRALSAGLPYLAVLGLYLVARHFALGHEASPLYRLTPWAHAATGMFVLGRYVALLLVPAGLDAHYPYEPIQTLASPLAILSAFMLGVIAWGAWRLRRLSPISCYWIVWIFVSLTPVLTFGTFGDVLMADRFLYIPSVGLCMLAARCAAAWASHADRPGLRPMTYAAVAGFLAVLTFGSAARARVWTDDLRLFSRMVETSPHSPMVRCNLGLAYYNKGHFKAATQEFESAIRLYPKFSMAHNNLAAALEREGRLGEALASYERALRVAPRQVESRINAASLRVRLGMQERGIQELDALIELHPRYTPGIYAYADAMDQIGRDDDALMWTRRVLAIDPAYPNAHYLEGKLLAQKGETRQAAAAMRRFLELWPSEGVHAAAARRVIAQAEGS